jgi:hypothetical protein
LESLALETHTKNQKAGRVFAATAARSNSAEPAGT